MDHEYGYFHHEITEDESFRFHMAYDYRRLEYTGTNFFASTFTAKRRENLIIINPLTGLMEIGRDDGARFDTFFEKGEDCYAHMKWLPRFSIFDLSRLEVVNTHQWESIQPIQHKDEKGQVLETEPALWDVATMVISSSVRVLFLRGHVDRDYAGMIQQRVQNLIDYLAMVSEGYEPLMAEYAKMGAVNIKDLPEDRQDEAREMLANIRERMAANPPQWYWRILLPEGSVLARPHAERIAEYRDKKAKVKAENERRKELLSQPREVDPKRQRAVFIGLGVLLVIGVLVSIFQ